MNRDCGKVTPAPASFPKIAPKLGSHRWPFVGSQSARQERCQNGIEWGGQARQLKMPLLPLLPPKPHPTTFTVPALQRRSRGTTRVVTASLQPGSGVVGHAGPYLEIGGNTSKYPAAPFLLWPTPKKMAQWHSGTLAQVDCEAPGSRLSDGPSSSNPTVTVAKVVDSLVRVLCAVCTPCQHRTSGRTPGIGLQAPPPPPPPTRRRRQGPLG